MTHEYKRNGTTLFAELSMLDGKVIGFLCFLRLIDQQTPSDLDLHLIVDNYAIHKIPLLNTPRRIRLRAISVRRSVVAQHVAELNAITDCLEKQNADPQPTTLGY
jgi:hypothetical protein